MSGARTERPTPKRLVEARRRGEVAVSHELTGAVALLAGLAVLAACAPWWFAALAGEVRNGLLIAIGAERPPAAALTAAALAVLRLSAPPALAAAAAAVAAGLLQTGGLFTLASLSPRWERLDPIRGLGRLFSGARLASLGLGLVKAALAVAMVLSGWRATAATLAQLPRSEAPGRAYAPLLWPLAWRLALLLVLFGALDLLLVRWRHQRQLRMSRDEVRREAREEEGDPRHRSERRQLHRALAEAAPVARATCLVVNPDPCGGGPAPSTRRRRGPARAGQGSRGRGGAAPRPGAARRGPHPPRPTAGPGPPPAGRGGRRDPRGTLRRSRRAPRPPARRPAT